MRERAMLIGAQLTIMEPPTGGTQVQLSIPSTREPNDNPIEDSHPRRR
jgi:nitrate/nitrite-specific signal transduction histidine kinase